MHYTQYKMLICHSQTVFHTQSYKQVTAKNNFTVNFSGKKHSENGFVLNLCKGSGEVLKRKMIEYFIKKIDCTLVVFNYMYMISSNDQYSIMQVTKVYLVIIIVSQ